MKFRSRRRVFKRTSEGKRRRLTNPSNKEDYVPSSDSDSSSGSDENIKEKPQPDEENGGANVLDSDDKGKDVIVLSEGQTGSDDSDYVQNISMKKKMNSNKEKECSKDKKKRSHKTGKRKGEAHEEGHEIHRELIVEADDANRSPSNKQNRRKRRKRRQRPTLMWEVLEEKNERWIDEHENSDVDLDFQDEGVAETAEPPSDFLVTLLRYQKEWLAWALKQEDSAARGGILADEMGMGKTLQAIALVLAKRVICQAGCSYSSSPSSSMGLPEIKCTLVICPMVAVRQWVYEIERSTPKGSTKVLVYHGSNRWKSLKQFSEYDFVLTTYTIVEAEYRKNVLPPKEKCIWCGKLYYPKKMTIHQRYFCGPHAVKTAGQSKQEKKESKHRVKISETKTKSAAVKAKTSEFEDKKVKVATKRAKKQIKEQKESDIGSYKGSSTSLEQGYPAKKSILHSLKWERIILDEAHYIKDRRSNTTRAVVALESSYKWALSGTPLQNRVGELYSLVRFLRITPFSFYFCRDCDCRVLDYSSTNTCPNCDHKPVRHFCWWNRYVGTPMQSLGNTDQGRRAMILLKHRLLKTIVLRRTKKGRAADLALPPRIVLLRRDTMDDKEEDYYHSLYNESQSQFNTYVEAGTLMNNYAHIFDLLTRLRQAVNHPYLVIYSKTAEKRGGGIADTDEKDCGICDNTAEDPVVTSCAHVFCMACLLDFSDALEQVSCPSCSKPLTVDLTSKLNSGDQSIKTIIKGFKPLSILNRIRLDNFQTSTKIEALREEIRFMIERDGSAKGIVFSQFTSFLDLIHYSLQKSGINCVQLVGSMSMTARDAAITRFSNDPDCRIFLMSLKAGAVALNLTVASHVFLMDPWWNPAIEHQAQGRIHRIGQHKPVRTVRFIIEDTIEERILKLQERKELVFEGIVGGSSEALGKLTWEDLRFLFFT